MIFSNFNDKDLQNVIFYLISQFIFCTVHVTDFYVILLQFFNNVLIPSATILVPIINSIDIVSSNTIIR